MTREKKLREVLNVRLDAPLAREIQRIATTRGTSESDAARMLLRYGIEVSRRIEAYRLARPFEWEADADPNRDPWDHRPQMLLIDVSWRDMSDDEMVERGMGWMLSVDQDAEEFDGEP